MVSYIEVLYLELLVASLPWGLTGGKSLSRQTLFWLPTIEAQHFVPCFGICSSCSVTFWKVAQNKEFILLSTEKWSIEGEEKDEVTREILQTSLNVTNINSLLESLKLVWCQCTCTLDTVINEYYVANRDTSLFL